jgi:diaminopimelate epimerase
VSIEFTKYHGTGNDFIMIDNRDLRFDLNSQQIQHLCDRHFGIGSDGLILIEPPRHHGQDFYMNFYNPDGSSSFCGNGSRCAVKFASELGMIAESCSFAAIDGPHEATLSKNEIAVKMKDVYEIVHRGDGAYFLNTGSPHYVQIVRSVEQIDIHSEAKPIRYHEDFAPSGTNVNFIEKLSNNMIRMRTFERGVEDETLSCGTGVTAAAIVFAIHEQLDGEIQVHTRGGELAVSFDKNIKNHFSNIFLKGPAKKVFSGTISVL